MKIFSLLSGAIAILTLLSTVVLAQKSLTSKTPLSVCEVIKNKSKYKNKEILLVGVYEIAAETSPLYPEGDCSKYDAITAGPDDAFEKYNDPEMVRKFNQATDLLGAIEGAGNNLLRNRFCCFMRMKITAYGLFLYSHKGKYGHLNSYKIAFLIRRVEDISNSRMVISRSEDDYKR